jgi:putative heme-binding domain-containing protein
MAGEAPALPVLRALREIGSQRADLFAKLAESAANPLVRDEALSALASSKSADAPQRVLSLYARLAAPQRRTALDKLTTTKAGANAVVAAVISGTLPKTDLGAATLDRLLAVLGDKDPALNSLVENLGTLFRPVLALDGSDGAFVETGLTLDGPFTVECWVKLDEGISNADGILGADGQLDINFAGEQFRVWAGKEAWDPAIAKKKTVAGMWTHVAASRDADGRWKVYLDGELSDAGTKTAAHKIENVRIGYTIAAGGTKGQFAEFRIWKGERSAAEIRANFDRSIVVGPLWVFEGTNAKDGTNASQLKLGPGARVLKTSDLPPVLTTDAATKLDADFSKYTALAAQSGDKERGKAVSIVCQACHLFGTTGGQIGPNLSGIGAMGTEAILRNILTPNAAMESAYRIYRVEQRDGSVLEAFFVSEDKEAVVVRLPGAPDQRIDKKDIVRTSFLRRSLMPEGLLMGMNDQQVSDLFAYLKSIEIKQLPGNGGRGWTGWTKCIALLELRQFAPNFFSQKFEPPRGLAGQTKQFNFPWLGRAGAEWAPARFFSCEFSQKQSGR